MNARETNQQDDEKSSNEITEDSVFNALGLFALLYKIDQRNKEEKDVGDKSGNSSHPPTKGMRLQDKRQIGNKCHFIFQDRQDRELLIQDFFNDGLVSITAFKNALQDLKTLVFNI